MDIQHTYDMDNGDYQYVADWLADNMKGLLIPPDTDKSLTSLRKAGQIIFLMDEITQMKWVKSKVNCPHLITSS